MSQIGSVETLDVKEEELDVPKRPNKRRKKRIIISVVAVLVVAAVGLSIAGRVNSKKAQTGRQYADYTVGRRSISTSISGTGTLKPANSYTVTTLISGEILQADFEEGDIVEKDAVLYVVDSSDVATGIEQAEISLAQSRRNYEQRLKSLEDLDVKATKGGKIIELLVEVGDSVTAGQTLASIRDSATMSLVLPFESSEASKFYVGQQAKVTLDGSFEILDGRISKVSTLEKRLEGNMLVREVTIEVANPGGIEAGQAATAMVGDIACSQSGTFSYKAEATVKAAVSGEVEAIYAQEGDVVAEGQTILRLKNEALQNEVLSSADALRNSELALQNRYDQLENYTIKSPIAGTIIEKNYKKGDTLESGKPLCVIFDLSYLTMTLNVDELDISKIEVGQPVKVTAEALGDKTYRGVVTKININGTTVSGATSYPVTIRIDETDGLLPGMNVQAEIITDERENVLAIPVAALLRGNRVLVKTGETDPNAPAGGDVPQGYTYVNVKPGISDSEYIEVVEGLNEGDIIAVPAAELMSAGFQFGFVGGGGTGGMAPAGRAPSGGGPVR